jgi:hypothetical protein
LVWLKPLTPHTQELLGRAPITLEQFIQDFAPMWASTTQVKKE